MQFHSQLWLLMLIPLPFLALLRLWSHLSTGKGGERLVSPRLRDELIVGTSPWLRWTVFCLNLLAIAFLVVALARPQWGFHETEAQSEGRNVILAIDTSRSMLANDLQPDRLTRARLAAQDIVNAMPEDRIGLIAFAGRAFLQAPLTVDHDAIIESIEQLDTEIIPRGGTNLVAPVNMALETFEEAESEESALIIFSDGEDLEGGGEMPANLKEKASEVGLVIVTIGVGTETGSIIPEPDENGVPRPGVFVTDESGNVVRSRLDPAAMQNLSAESGAGVYLNLAGGISIAGAVEKAIGSLATTRREETARRVPKERFMWPLGIAIVLWVFAFLLPASTRSVARALHRGEESDLIVPPPLPVTRGRSIVSGLAVASMLLAAVSGGAEESSLGFEALRRGQFGEAVELYERELTAESSERKRRWMALGLGVAAYAEGDLEKAGEGFGRVLASRASSRKEVEQAHYNVGNTLFRNGETIIGWTRKPGGSAGETPLPDPQSRDQAREQWEKAIEHYEAALEIDEANEKAKKNIEVVKQHLEYLDRIEEQEEEQQQEEEEQPEDEEKNEDEEKEEQEENEQNQDQNQDKSDDRNEDQDDSGKQDENRDKGDQGDKGEKQESENEDGKGEEQEQEKSDARDGKGNEQEQEPFQPDGQQDPANSEPAGDGDLEANPSQQQPLDQRSANVNPADLKRNPETGYTPSEARRKLEALSDESLEVRPVFEPVRAEKFKNW